MGIEQNAGQEPIPEDSTNQTLHLLLVIIFEISKASPEVSFERNFEKLRAVLVELIESDYYAQQMVSDTVAFSSINNFLVAADSDVLFADLSTYAQTAIYDQLRSVAATINLNDDLEYSVKLKDVWEDGERVDVEIYYSERPVKDNYGLPITESAKATEIAEIPEPEWAEGEYVTAEMETARKREKAEYESTIPLIFSRNCYEGHENQVTDVYRGAKPKIKGKGKKWYVDLEYGEVSCSTPGCVNDVESSSNVRNIHFGKPRRVEPFYRHQEPSKEALEAWLIESIRKIER